MKTVFQVQKSREELYDALYELWDLIEEAKGSEKTRLELQAKSIEKQIDGVTERNAKFFECYKN